MQEVVWRRPNGSTCHWFFSRFTPLRSQLFQSISPTGQQQEIMRRVLTAGSRAIILCCVIMMMSSGSAGSARSAFVAALAASSSVAPPEDASSRDNSSCQKEDVVIPQLPAADPNDTNIPRSTSENRFVSRSMVPLLSTLTERRGVLPIGIK